MISLKTWSQEMADGMSRMANVGPPLRGADAAQAKPMQRHPNSARFHEILGELGALHDKKQRDYGRAGDPFANVRASEEWGIAPWVGAMVRLNDKVRRLQVAAQGGTLVNESVEDSMRDIAVYSVIALVLWEQEQMEAVPF